MSTSLSFDNFPQEILSIIFSNLNLNELITMYFNKIHMNITGYHILKYPIEDILYLLLIPSFYKDDKILSLLIQIPDKMFIDENNKIIYEIVLFHALYNKYYESFKYLLKTLKRVKNDKIVDYYSKENENLLEFAIYINAPKLIISYIYESGFKYLSRKEIKPYLKYINK
jgi:hypothetical protein